MRFFGRTVDFPGGIAGGLVFETGAAFNIAAIWSRCSGGACSIRSVISRRMVLSAKTRRWMIGSAIIRRWNAIIVAIISSSPDGADSCWCSAVSRGRLARCLGPVLHAGHSGVGHLVNEQAGGRPTHLGHPAHHARHVAPLVHRHHVASPIPELSEPSRSLPFRTIRSRPGRSVTSMSPPGRKAIDYGFIKPWMTGTIRKSCWAER